MGAPLGGHIGPPRQIFVGAIHELPRFSRSNNVSSASR
jgi:hypothetical protein